MEPAITARVHMRLFTRVDQRSPIHRVDAHNHAEEIGALRDLIDAGLALSTLGFDAHLARTRANLASYEKQTHLKSGAPLLISAPRSRCQNAFPCLVLCNDLPKGCALRRRIFRVCVIVV